MSEIILPTAIYARNPKDPEISPSLSLARSVKSFPPSARNDRPQFAFDCMRVAAGSTWPAEHEIIVPRFSHPFPCQGTESRRIAIFDPRDGEGYLLKT